MRTDLIPPEVEQIVQSLTPDDARRIIDLQIGDYANIRSRYNNSLRTALEQFMSTDQEMKVFVAVMIGAVIANWGAMRSFLAVESELDDELNVWYDKQIRVEQANVRKLARGLARDKATGNFELARVVQEHAEGYVRGLDRIFNNLHVARQGARILTFGGTPGQENCSDCAELQGQSHPARWWWETDSIPPNRRFRCGGWSCHHYLYDLQGRLFTL